MGDLRVVQPKKKKCLQVLYTSGKISAQDVIACCVIYAKHILETAFHEPVG